MSTVPAEWNAHHMKLTHPKLFTAICHSRAGRLLGISDKHRIIDLLGDIQGPVDVSLASQMSVATTNKCKGIKFCLHRRLKSECMYLNAYCSNCHYTIHAGA